MRCLLLKMLISNELKQAIRERAKYICEYCHSPERLSANRFTIDHLIPRSLGGSDKLDNLALACRRCNERRYNFITGIDPNTQEIQKTILFEKLDDFGHKPDCILQEMILAKIE